MNENSCRICFTTATQSPLLPINLRSNMSSPSEKFKRLNLKIEGGYICTQCILKLDHAISFIEMCEKSNQIIAARLKSVPPWQSGKRDLNDKDLEGDVAEIVEEISESQCLKTDAVSSNSQCPHCGSHRRCKHWAPPTAHTCPYCKKQFNRKFNFNIHLKRHQGDSCWPCPSCGSGQVSRWLAQRHCRPRERRACPHPACRSSFTTVTNLNNHIRTHTGERPFSCAECGKSFSSKNTLTVHLRIHTGEKPYMCPVCGKQFANNKLSEHLASHAGETHPCPVDNCNKTFKSARTLRLHATAHAGGGRSYACAQCGARYAHTQSLRKHLRKRHAKSSDDPLLHPSNKQHGQVEVSTL